jgi:hypothetical protein
MQVAGAKAEHLPRGRPGGLATQRALSESGSTLRILCPTCLDPAPGVKHDHFSGRIARVTDVPLPY